MKNGSRQHLQDIVNVFDQSDDMHMLTDCAGVIEYVNPAFESSTGFGKDEVTGKTPVMFESGVHPADFYSAILDMLKNGSCSIGVSIYPRDGEEAGELLRCADIAMYRTKAKGGNDFSFYSEQNESSARAVARQRAAECRAQKNASVIRQASSCHTSALNCDLEGTS